MRAALLVLLAWCLVSTAWAFDSAVAFDDPAQQARYERLNRELRCLQCQNQTIADSTAPLAADLRREVREMIKAGRSDAEIRQFMLDRYGDFVLYRPRVSGATFLLWAAPALLLLIGGLAAVRFIRRRTAEVDVDDTESGAGAA
jgi:cytochrome c-type biogenesis protein CcmH